MIWYDNIWYDAIWYDTACHDIRLYDKVILDCTHSTQRSRSVYGSQGDPVLAARYFVSCDLFNYDGVFAETHPVPEDSVSDGECAIHLDDLSDLVLQSRLISATINTKDKTIYRSVCDGSFDWRI